MTTKRERDNQRAIARRSWEADVKIRALTPINIERLFCFLTNLKPTSRSKRKNKSQIRFGTKGSLSVVVDGGNKRGFWEDHDEKRGGNIFAAIGRWIGISEYRDQIDWLADWLHISPFDPGAKIDHEKIAKELQAARESAAREKKRRDDEAAQEAIKTQERMQWRWDNQCTELAPISGFCLASDYLTGERKIPLMSPPPGVRFDRRRQAVAFAATDDAGKVWSIQYVAVTGDGRKDTERVWNPKEPSKRYAKHTAASFNGAVLRLSRAGDGPRIICEGPETALSAWAAGYDAIATFGGIDMEKLSALLVRGRKNVICFDDDPHNPKTEQSRRRWIKHHRKAGFDVVAMRPFAVRRYNKNDLNDLMKEAGVDGVRRRIERFLTDGAPVVKEFVTLEDARAMMAKRFPTLLQELADWRRQDDSQFAPAKLVEVTAGVGKTQAIINALVRSSKKAVSLIDRMREDNDTRSIAIAIPYFDLADDWIDRYDDTDAALAAQLDEIEAEIVAAVGDKFVVKSARGREARQPRSTETMCKNIEVVREAYRMRADIKSEICDKECPFRDGCAYLAQKTDKADIWLVSHQSLFNRVPSQIGKDNLALVIIDESPEHAGFLKDAEILVRTICDMPVGKNELLATMRRDLVEAIERNGPGPMSADNLRAVGFAPGAGKLGAEMERDRKIEDGPWREREANLSIGGMMRAFYAVDAILTHNKAASGWLRVEHDNAGNLVLRVRGVKQIARGWRIPSLHIDATPSPALRRNWWPQIDVLPAIEVDTSKHVEIFQCTEETFAKRAMEALPGTPTSPEAIETNAKRAKKRRNTRAFIATLHRLAGGKTGAIFNKGVEADMRLDEIPGITTGHFNAIAGKDGWKDATTLVVTGWTLPPAYELERLAEAITGDAVAPLRSGLFPSRDAERLVRRDGKIVAVPAETIYHPDPTCEALRSFLCDAGLVQAADRLRRVSRTADKPGRLVILNRTVLPIPIDGEIDADLINFPAPRDLMLAEAGIMFESIATAARAYPGLWDSAKALSNELSYQKKREAGKAVSQTSSVLLSHRDSNMRYSATAPGETGLLPAPAAGLARLEFQRVAAGAHVETAYYDPARVADPKAKIVDMIGAVRWLDDGDDAQQAQPIAVPAVVGALALKPEPANDQPVTTPSSRPPDWPPLKPGPIHDLAEHQEGAIILPFVHPDGSIWLTEQPADEVGERRDDMAGQPVEARERSDQGRIAPELPEPDELLTPTEEAPPKRAKREARKADELAGANLDWLSPMLADCGLTRTEFARRVGVSPSHLRNLETGHRHATPQQIATIKRVAAELELNQGRLLL